MENLRNKVELIETKIELIEELMDFDKKSNAIFYKKSHIDKKITAFAI